MFSDIPFYHGTIRNTITAFGKLFSNIKIARTNINTGAIEQVINVPIAYSQKEKWLQSIQQNPEDTTGVYATLPRLAFEIISYQYDSTRKLARMNKITCPTEDGKSRVFTPTPYNIDISLNFVTKTQGDGLQILEQILPTFAPDYTVSVKSVPGLNIVQDVPFILNGVSIQDDYEGDLETRRIVIHTLTFTAKINLFGPVATGGAIINQVEANLGDDPNLSYVASQESLIDPIVEEWMENF